MAVPAIAAKALKALASSKKGRKALLITALSPLLIAVLVFGLFFMLIAGLLAFFLNSNTQSNWRYVQSCIENVFSEVDYKINNDIKHELYNFMPDFSLNLSRAAVSQNYNNMLLVYDNEELKTAENEMKTAATKIRKMSDAEYKAYLTSYALSADDFSFSAIQADEKFISDDDTMKNAADYNHVTAALLQAIAKQSLNSCLYTIDNEYVSPDGVEGRKQTLVVTNKEDGTTQTVEYTAVGAVEIYLPRFLALYQVRAINTLNEASLEEAEKYAEDIDALGNELKDVDSEEDVQKLSDDYASGASPHMNIFDVASLVSILKDGLDGGVIDASYAYSTDEIGNEKLSLSLKAPKDTEWETVFDIPEDNFKYVDEFEQSIVSVLQEAGVPEADFWISLDDMFQSAIFVYFEGFFNLPVESNDLGGFSGIISALGDYQTVHRVGWNNPVVEEGVTLQLSKPEAPVMIDLLPTVGSDCFEDIVIYDIFVPTTQPDTKMFNSCAVTIAYYINTEVFKKNYGFDFPQITGINYEETPVITMLVEYSCLSSVAFDESYVGESIRDEVLNGKFTIGYSHTGELMSTDNGSGNLSHYYHSVLNSSDGAAARCVPHITVVMDFFDDYLNVPEQNAGQYNGLKTQKHNFSVNPLLWFKSFRTDAVNSELSGLLAANGNEQKEEKGIEQKNDEQ